MRQGPHKGYQSFETSKALLKKTCVQASVIAALIPGTRFIVFPRRLGSLVDIDDAKVLVLNKGPILVFRGDLAHAGADFDEENARLHCYWSKALSRRRTLLRLLHLRELKLICESRRHSANHIRTCKSGGSGDAEEDDDGAVDDEGATCESCGKYFAKINSYCQHRRHSILKVYGLKGSITEEELKLMNRAL
ncbi:hypothetical protein AM587_10013234 [Phytophthora nicotianae]|uniref:Uncharacterized protein n=1 Tax=Phytophthora nicotianae TaxID=4792 RepID=A0A0W8CF88_PHYNI|nr:hypothetical protein AM587_10013234 [Phytophthora nicotianae]